MDKKMLHLVNELLCSLKILDKKVIELEDCCENTPEKTSDLINDGESGDSYYIEEADLREILYKYELIENKQDSLDFDGTGTKYPTVDAVNTKIQELEESINNVSGDKNFIYHQNFPSATWEIIHNLNKKPSVTVTDSADTVVEGNIVINDGIKVVITFNAPFTGIAILN